MAAVGLIETRGLPEALEALDAMCKAADIGMIEAKRIGGGLITLIVDGDVAAVEAAVESGIGVLNRNGGEIICSRVIPNPHSELAKYLTAGASING